MGTQQTNVLGSAYFYSPDLDYPVSGTTVTTDDSTETFTVPENANLLRLVLESVDQKQPTLPNEAQGAVSVGSVLLITGAGAFIPWDIFRLGYPVSPGDTVKVRIRWLSHLQQGEAQVQYINSEFIAKVNVIYFQD